MAMQQSGKQPAAPSSDPKLSADDADELAANFKPAGEVDEPGESTIDTNDVPTIVTQGDPPTMTAVTQVNGSSGNGPAVVASPVISIGSPAPDPPKVAEVRAPEPSSEAIEPDAVIEMQPAEAAKAFSKTQPMSSPASQKPVSKPPPPMSTKPRSAPAPVSKSKDPFSAPAKAIRPPIESDDFAVPKKSGKGWVYVVVGVLVAVGAGGIVKFYMTPEPEKSATPTNVAVPTAAKEEVPPPPAKDEPPSAPATTAAKVDPPTPPPEPVKAAPPPPPQPVTPPPAPPPRQQPVAARGGGGGGVVRQAAPPPPPVQPKTPPKPPGGGIVRDNPF